MKPLFWPAAAVLVITGAALFLWWHLGPDTPPTPPPQDNSAAWFRDVTDEVGLDFVHDAGPLAKYPLPQITGSGGALFDFDNDGRLDIYLVQNGGPKSSSTNRLYRQLPNGKFQDVSKGSGLDIAGYNMGVAIGDINNDGWPDVLVTQYGGVKLFLNRGNGTFRDVTTEAGLNNPGWGTSAAFFDFDRDGWLDLVIVNYVDFDPSWPCTGINGQPGYCNPNSFPSLASRLFRNEGRGRGEGRGTRDERKPVAGSPLAPHPTPLAPPPSPLTFVPRFQDVTVASGLGKVPGPGLGVVCADFSGDGWPDIFIANDGKPNHLWINQKDGTFVEEGVTRGVAYNAAGQAQAGMGIALGDLDGDLLLDLFVTHLTIETHSLWKQGPPGMFQDHTVAAGLSKTSLRSTGFGTVAADFDQDGALDLAVANGRVEKTPANANPALGPHWGWYAERNQLLLNDGTGRFSDVSHLNKDFCGTPNVGRALACGDIDGDGALDLLLTTVGGRARLYRNVAPNRGHWLQLRAVDPALRRDMPTTSITVHAAGKRWLRNPRLTESYLCSSTPFAHFGLGKIDHVDKIEVIWPDGAKEIFPGTPVDRNLVLEKGKGSKQ